MYGYVLGDPVNFVDEDGLKLKDKLRPLGCVVNLGDKPLWIKPEEGKPFSTTAWSANVDGFWLNNRWYKISNFGICYILPDYDHAICLDPGNWRTGTNKSGFKGKCFDTWGCGPNEK